MVKMDKDRIVKLKCFFCGSKDKKIAILTNKNIKVGYATICCNCGHIDNYASNTEGILSILSGNVEVNTIKCAFPEGCNKKNCKYNPKGNKKNNKKLDTVYNSKFEHIEKPKYL